MEKAYYDAQVKYINEIRSIKHDMQAHLIVLQYYLDTEDYESAKSYLSDMKKHQYVASMVYKDTGHDMVNAIVSDILSDSKKTIEFCVDGILPMYFGMKDYDICTLFSNMISNAKEACERLENESSRICLCVKESDTEYLISMKNPIEWKVDMEGTRFVSTKKDKNSHGYGTKNMIKVVKQYKGNIDFLITDNMFSVDIVLPK